MSNSPSTLARPLALAGAVAVLGVFAWWGLSDDDSDASESAPTASAGSAPSRSGRGTRSTSREPVYPEPEVYDPNSDERPGTDDGRRTEEQGAAGTPAGSAVATADSDEPAPPGAYDEIPTLGVEEPMHEVDPDAPPAQPLPSGNTAPSTPERELGRAIFVRGLLQGRLRDLNEQLEFAIAHGDVGAEARARRLIANLEEQRPSVEERVEVLQHGLADGVTSPDER